MLYVELSTATNNRQGEEDGVTTTSRARQEHAAVTVVHRVEHCNGTTDRVKKMVLQPPVGPARNTLLYTELNTATEQQTG